MSGRLGEGYTAYICFWVKESMIDAEDATIYCVTFISCSILKISFKKLGRWNRMVLGCTSRELTPFVTIVVKRGCPEQWRNQNLRRSLLFVNACWFYIASSAFYIQKYLKWVIYIPVLAVSLISWKVSLQLRLDILYDLFFVWFTQVAFERLKNHRSWPSFMLCAHACLFLKYLSALVKIFCPHVPKKSAHRIFSISAGISASEPNS